MTVHSRNSRLRACQRRSDRRVRDQLPNLAGVVEPELPEPEPEPEPELQPLSLSLGLSLSLSLGLS